MSEVPRIPFAGDTQFSCWHIGVFFFFFWERSAQDSVSTDIAVESKVICFCITCVEVILYLRRDSGRGCTVIRAGNQKVGGSN